MYSSEHSQLLLLERAVLADLDQYAASNQKPTNQKLNAGIQDKLSKIRALTRDLELLVEEADSDEERQQVATLLTGHAAEYNRVQQALKAAVQQQRQNAAQAAATERRELLGGPGGAVRRRQLQTDADVVGASEGITESLRRTRQMMGEELEHTSATLAAMEASHEQLGRTQQEYTGQHGLLGKSRGLLRMLDWQNRAETYMLWFGLGLFFLVAAYIAQKRAMHFVPHALRPMSLLSSASSLVRGKPAPPPPAGPVPLPTPPSDAEHGGGKGGVRAVPAPGLPQHIAHRDAPAAAPSAQSRPAATTSPDIPAAHPPSRTEMVIQDAGAPVAAVEGHRAPGEDISTAAGGSCAADSEEEAVPGVPELQSGGGGVHQADPLPRMHADEL